MEVLQGLPKTPLEEPVFLAIGNFDGVHRGHQALISQAISEAEKRGGKGAVLTFDPHPLTILKPGFSPNLILTRKQKIAKIAALGVDYLCFLTFTKELADKKPEDFLNMLVKKFKPKGVFVGFNFSFGKGGAGDPDFLKVMGKKLGFDVHIIPAQTYEQRIISSTNVRNALAAGNIELAKELLGYWPVLEGRVTDGEKRGRQLGYPTANLRIDDNIILPQGGVYAASTWIKNRRYLGVVNIGKKPTFSNGKDISVEIHLLDFNENIYGMDLEMHFLGRLRSESKFANYLDLVSQIKSDIGAAQKLVKRLELSAQIK